MASIALGAGRAPEQSIIIPSYSTMALQNSDLGSLLVNDLFEDSRMFDELVESVFQLFSGDLDDIQLIANPL